MDDVATNVGQEHRTAPVAAVAAAAAALAPVAPVWRYVLPKQKKGRIACKRKNSSFDRPSAARTLGLSSSATFMEVYSASSGHQEHNRVQKHSPSKSYVKRENKKLKKYIAAEQSRLERVKTKVVLMSKASCNLSRQLKKEKATSRLVIGELMRKGEAAMVESQRILRDARNIEKELEKWTANERAASCAALRTQRRRHRSCRQKKYCESCQTRNVSHHCIISHAFLMRVSG